MKYSQQEKSFQTLRTVLKRYGKYLTRNPLLISPFTKKARSQRLREKSNIYIRFYPFLYDMHDFMWSEQFPHRLVIWSTAEYSYMQKILLR